MIVIIETLYDFMKWFANVVTTRSAPPESKLYIIKAICF